MSAAVEAPGAPAESLAVSESLAALSEEVRKACDRTISVYQVAALLESAGVTDAITQARYGHRDIFDLARTIAGRLTYDHHPASLPADAVFPQDSSRDALLDYLRGPLALIPMVLLSFIIAVYQGIGRWGSEEILATSMAMVCSLLITSGFVQAASRKGASYLSQGYVRAGRRSVGLIAGAGMAAVIGSAGLFAALALAMAWLPSDEVILISVAYVALSALWLASGVLFLLNQIHWYGISLAIGVSLSLLVMWVGSRSGFSAGVGMLGATAVGLVGSLAAMALVARRALARQAASSAVAAKHVILAPAPQLVFGLAPYFVYGIAYVVLILAGHVAGWVGRVPGGLERMSAIATVEVGLTLALGGNILAGGVAERTMRRFWQRVRFYQLQTSQDQPESFNLTVRDFVAQERRRFVAALVLCSAVTLVGVWAAIGLARRAGVTSLQVTPQTVTVLVLGMVGYGLMAVGTFNCMFMITLSRPRQAVEALGIGILVTLVAGVAISRLTSYQFSAIGVALGGGAFVAIAHAWLRHMLAHADYYYYSSF